MFHIREEARLVRKAQQGDMTVLGMLWDAFTPKLFGYLVNVLRDRALAEDVLQATWLRAIEALPRFRFRGVSMSAWLFAIARNECRKHWRKSGLEIQFDLLQHDKADDSSSGIPEHILAEQTLRLLSETDRELLRLRYIADLSLKDIALILNLNFVAVRVRIHRALGRARAIVTSQTI